MTTQTFIMGEGHLRREFVKEGSGAWVVKVGYVLKYGSKYWAWNSFKCVPYLSGKDTEEVFQTEESAKRWAIKHSITANVVELVARECPSGYFAFLRGEHGQKRISRRT